MRPYPHSRSYKAVLNKLKSDGNEVGLEYCEKFQTIRRIIS